MSKVAVWLTNYGNEKHLDKAIRSVLSQSHQELTLFVFDNHSPGEAPNIISAYVALDKRVVAVPIPPGLAGIPLMKFAWDTISATDSDYSITLGGHDYWPNTDHLKILVERMDQENAVDRVALIYTDTWQVGEDDQLVGRYGNFLQQGGNMGRPFIPQWVVGGIDCTPLFGLWNENVRRRVPVRHTCAGWDHLVVTHAALKGRLLYEWRTPLIMRAPAPGDGPEQYGKRHFSPEALKGKDQDFINQLEWLVHCLDEACDTAPGFHHMMLTTSMFAMYVCLRGYNLAVFPGGLEAFNANPKAQRALSACIEAARAVRDLTS